MTLADLVHDPRIRAEAIQLLKKTARLDIRQQYLALKKLTDKAPWEPALQLWMHAIHGDYSQILSPAQEYKTKLAAAAAIRSLTYLPQMENRLFRNTARNEICYHSFDFLGQYKLGVACNREKRNTGWFSQGVGASEHAYQEFRKGHTAVARKFAALSLRAWQRVQPKKPLERGNTFYTQALAILGQIEEAFRGIDELERKDKHRRLHEPWYTKYRKRTAAIESALRRKA
jgi:hypothetical protein